MSEKLYDVLIELSGDMRSNGVNPTDLYINHAARETMQKQDGDTYVQARRPDGKIIAGCLTHVVGWIYECVETNEPIAIFVDESADDVGETIRVLRYSNK